MFPLGFRNSYKFACNQKRFIIDEIYLFKFHDFCIALSTDLSKTRVFFPILRHELKLTCTVVIDKSMITLQRIFCLLPKRPFHSAFST